MRFKWLLATLMVASAAQAAHPPIFSPKMETIQGQELTWEQRQLADHALDVLFDACPALVTWLPDMDSATMHIDDLANPLNSGEVPLFKPYGWKNVLVVMISTTPKPHSKILIPYAGPAGIDIDFYLGGGAQPGIYMESRFFPTAVCGAKNTVKVRSPFNYLGETDAPDTFVPVPALKFLNGL